VDKICRLTALACLFSRPSSCCSVVDWCFCLGCKSVDAINSLYFLQLLSSIRKKFSGLLQVGFLRPACTYLHCLWLTYGHSRNIKRPQNNCLLAITCTIFDWLTTTAETSSDHRTTAYLHLLAVSLTDLRPQQKHQATAEQLPACTYLHCLWPTYGHSRNIKRPQNNCLLALTCTVFDWLTATADTSSDHRTTAYLHLLALSLTDLRPQQTHQATIEQLPHRSQYIHSNEIEVLVDEYSVLTMQEVTVRSKLHEIQSNETRKWFPSSYLNMDGLNEFNSTLKFVPSKKLYTRPGRRKVLGSYLF